MKTQIETPNRRSRLDTWRQTQTPLMNQLPQNYREYILATMDKDGREQLKSDRLAEFQSICSSHRLSSDKENLTTIIVTFIGALTFSVAPQAGRDPLHVRRLSRWSSSQLLCL
jgi:hypothetical protein